MIQHSETKHSADFIEILKTQSEANHFCSQINLLSDSLYSKKINIINSFEEVLTADIKNLLLKKLKTSDIPLSDPMSVQKYLSEIKHEIKKSPIIHITLSFRPKQSTIERIYTWISFHVGQNFLIDFKLDKDLLGGAIIEYEGKYFEFSLRMMLREKISTLISG